MAGPLPHRIVSAMEPLETATVGEIAAATGDPPESLYYHVRRLARVGILVHVGKRSTGGRPEAVWRLPAEEIVFDKTSTDPAYLEALSRSVASLLKMVERAYRASVRPGGGRRTGRRRTLMVQQHVARLRQDDLATLNRRLEEIADFVRERDVGAKATARTSSVSLTMIMTPTHRHD